jgi:DNA uptake protein ComE-like DNA-binding protein
MTKINMNTVKPVITLVAVIALAFTVALAGTAAPKAGSPDTPKAPKAPATPAAGAMEEGVSAKKPANRSTSTAASPLTETKPKASNSTGSKKAKTEEGTETGSKEGPKPVAKDDSKVDSKYDSKVDSRSAATGTNKSPTPVLDLTPTQEDKLLGLLNDGTTDDLTAISGIAATRAEAIVSARPFQNVHEIMLVPGVGGATFERILAHGKTLTQPAAKSAKS